MNSIYTKLTEQREQGKKSFAVLLDPDNVDMEQCVKLIHLAIECKVDYFFVGGSLLLNHDNLEVVINTIKSLSSIPVVLFPGSYMQVNPKADGILLLSLISGRNAEFLIGHHVTAAPMLKKSNLEILPTGYILVDCGKPTTVSYISNTYPIPYDKPSIAASTALAGELLGLKLIFLDGGSGAAQPISSLMIQEVKQYTNSPLVVGGGINSGEKAYLALSAGADLIVVGNGIEKDSSLLIEISEVITELNSKKISTI